MLLSFLSIVLGELVPKTLAVHRADSVALLVARPIDFLAKIMRPLVLLLTGVTNVILRLLGSHERANMPSVSEAEILAMLETAEDEGVVERGEAELVEEALEFGDIQVRSVMVPRVDVTGDRGGARSVGDAMKMFSENRVLPPAGLPGNPRRRPRHPAYQGCLPPDLGQPESRQSAGAELVRPAYVVPETRPIDDLLQTFAPSAPIWRSWPTNTAAWPGMVTLEDLLEELVGEIADEFDPGYEPVLRIGDTTLARSMAGSRCSTCSM